MEKKSYGGKILADCIRDLGVNKVFTVPGESFLAALNGLYDHKNDKNELINLVNNQDYNKVMDSLKLVIEKRIVEASIKPEGLGRQFEKVKPMYKAKNITFGDIHDEEGEISHLKKK